MTTKNKIIAVIVILALGYGIGYFTKPAKVVEVVKKEIVQEEAKTKIVYKERIVKPDGTIIERELEKERQKITKKVKEESSKITSNRLGLTIQALAYVPVNKLTDRDYGVIISKRVIGNFVVGAMATTNKKIGLTVGVEF